MPTIEQPPIWRVPVTTSAPASTGPVTVDSQAMQACISELANIVTESVAVAMGQALTPVMQDAIAQWPTQSGRSQDALVLRYEQSFDALVAVLDDEVDYANDINRGETAEQLIEEPAAVATDQLVISADNLITGRGRG